MNYPVWYLPSVGGGLLIALIAILHVFVSHFAVGGGLYLIYAEKKGLQENSQAILDFTRKHARFFLLLTMVFGSITGVGIWFIIALVNPAATSLLIHKFVFGWAAEWVFFTVEIAAAFVYYYMFGKMDTRSHLQVGWLYFFAAFMSLLLINGIIGVMLTPGAWTEQASFWVGFFNPSFWPSLVFRTFAAVALAGVYGLLTASFSADVHVRTLMSRFSGKWALVAIAGAAPSAWWYLSVLPAEARNLVMGKSPTITMLIQWGGISLVVLVILLLVVGLLFPVTNRKPIAACVMICSLLAFGSFEWIREAARRPYVINGMLYSNSIPEKALPDLNSKGFLASSRWVKEKNITAANQMTVGKELFIHQCYPCHTLDGMNNAIKPLTAKMSYTALSSYLGKIHKVRYFMPPFAGTDQEMKALAAYLSGELHGKKIEEPPAAAGTTVDGEKVFEANCAACHAYTDLAPKLATKTPDEMGQMLLTLNTISDEMQPFAGPEDERKALAGYLTGKKTGSTQSTSAKPDGKQVFEMNCAACHGYDDLKAKLTTKDSTQIADMLGHLNEISSEMEPFSGSPAERDALADSLAQKGATP